MCSEDPWRLWTTPSPLPEKGPTHMAQTPSLREAACPWLVSPRTASVSRLPGERRDRPLKGPGLEAPARAVRRPRQASGSPSSDPERWEPRTTTRGRPRFAEGPGSLYNPARLGGRRVWGAWLQWTRVLVHRSWGTGKTCRCKIVPLLRKLEEKRPQVCNYGFTETTCIFGSPPLCKA